MENLKTNDDLEQRPAGKPNESIAGRLLRWRDSDYTVFAPRKKREEPAHTILKEAAGFRFYKNEGKKENSYSVHATIDGSEPNPANALATKIMAGLGSELKKEPKFSAVNFIEDQEDFKVWTADRNKVMKVLLTFSLAEDHTLMSQRVLGRATDMLGIISRKKWRK